MQAKEMQPVTVQAEAVGSVETGEVPTFSHGGWHVQDASAPPKGRFHDGLFDCFNHLESCICGWCCPSCFIGELASAIGFSRCCVMFSFIMAVVGIYESYVAVLTFCMAVELDPSCTTAFESQAFEDDCYRSVCWSPSLPSNVVKFWSGYGDFTNATGITKDNLDNGQDHLLARDVQGSEMWWTLDGWDIFIGICAICVMCEFRKHFRTMYNIPGSCWGDFWTMFCCGSCAMCQMARHAFQYDNRSPDRPRAGGLCNCEDEPPMFSALYKTP